MLAEGYAVHHETFHLAGTRFQCADQDVYNLVADLPGTQHSDQIVVVVAHYDSRAAMSSWHEHVEVLPDQRGTPGANDNGSGVAAVLALAGQLAKQPQSRTIRFCFWVNEEPPFYHTTDIDAMGSYVSASRSRERCEDLRAVLSFDVAGCYSPQPTRKRNAVLNAIATSIGLPPTTDYVAFLSVIRMKHWSRDVLPSTRSMRESPYVPWCYRTSARWCLGPTIGHTAEISTPPFALRIRHS